MKIRCFKIEGNSMTPTLVPGDFAITIKRHRKRYRTGDMVVVQHPSFNAIVKRIKKIEGSFVLLAGDNTASTRPDDIGWQPVTRILGKVVWRFSGSGV